MGLTNKGSGSDLAAGRSLQIPGSRRVNGEFRDQSYRSHIKIETGRIRSEPVIPRWQVWSGN